MFCFVFDLVDGTLLRNAVAARICVCNWSGHREVSALLLLTSITTLASFERIPCCKLG